MDCRSTLILPSTNQSAYTAVCQLHSRGTLSMSYEGGGFLKRHTWCSVGKDKSKEETMLEESGSRNSFSSPMRPKEAGQESRTVGCAGLRGGFTCHAHLQFVRCSPPSSLPRPAESLQTFGSKFGALSLSRSLSNGDLNCHGHGHGHGLFYLVVPPSLPGKNKSDTCSANLITKHDADARLNACKTQGPSFRYSVWILATHVLSPVWVEPTERAAPSACTV